MYLIFSSGCRSLTAAASPQTTKSSPRTSSLPSISSQRKTERPSTRRRDSNRTLCSDGALRCRAMDLNVVFRWEIHENSPLKSRCEMCLRSVEVRDQKHLSNFGHVSRYLERHPWLRRLQRRKSLEQLLEARRRCIQPLLRS